LENLPQETFCHTGKYIMDSNLVWTGGLSTCIALCIKTRKNVFMWHFWADNINDQEYLDKLRACLTRIEMRKSSIFVVRGTDREEDTLSLKDECRTMKFRPDTDKSASANFLKEFLRDFSWFDKIDWTLTPSTHRQFIVLNKKMDRPVFVTDEKFFAKNCAVDAENMC
jgi:hypothetical protein